MIMILYYADINRLVEGWDIAFEEHFSHKLNPSLNSSMNLELVFVDANYSIFGGTSARYSFVRLTSLLMS